MNKYNNGCSRNQAANQLPPFRTVFPIRILHGFQGKTTMRRAWRACACAPGAPARRSKPVAPSPFCAMLGVFNVCAMLGGSKIALHRRRASGFHEQRASGLRRVGLHFDPSLTCFTCFSEIMIMFYSSVHGGVFRHSSETMRLYGLLLPLLPLLRSHKHNGLHPTTCACQGRQPAGQK